MDTTLASPKSDASTAHQPDFYLACHCDVRGWGGGLAFAAGLHETLRQAGYGSLILGFDDRRGWADPAAPVDGLMNLPGGVSPQLWRVRNWCLPEEMACGLRHLPPPWAAFVAVSPPWVVAARRAWGRWSIQPVGLRSPPTDGVERPIPALAAEGTDDWPPARCRAGGGCSPELAEDWA